MATRNIHGNIFYNTYTFFLDKKSDNNVLLQRTKSDRRFTSREAQTLFLSNTAPLRTQYSLKQWPAEDIEVRDISRVCLVHLKYNILVLKKLTISYSIHPGFEITSHRRTGKKCGRGGGGGQTLFCPTIEKLPGIKCPDFLTYN